MRTEDKYRKDVESKFVAEDHFEELAAKLELKSEKKSSKTPLIASLSSLLALGLTAGIIAAIVVPMGSTNPDFTTGKITDPEKKEKASALYSNSYTTLANLESNNTNKKAKRANDLTEYSYHVDYKLHYAMEATAIGMTWAESDDESYSLDFIQDANGTRFEMNSVVTLAEETPLTHYVASHNINAIYRDGRLYTKQSVSWSTTLIDNFKIDINYYYTIGNNEIFNKFPEYFISMLENARFSNLTDDENIALINSIINEGEAEVVETKPHSIKVATDTDEALITTNIDTDNGRFNGIRFDYSKLKSEITIEDNPLVSLDKYEFSCELNFKYDDDVKVSDVVESDYLGLSNFLHYSAFDEETDDGYSESRSYHGGHNKTSY